MKMKAIFLSALLSVAPVWAQSPSPESLKKLAELQRIDRQFNDMLPIIEQEARAGMIASLREGLVSRGKIASSSSSKLSAQKQQQVIDFLGDQTVDMIKKLFQSPEMIQVFVEGYEKYAGEVYTQEEVDAMIAFFSSELGQSVLQKQVKVQSGMWLMWRQQMQKVLSAEMKAREPIIKAKIDEILGTNNKQKRNKK